MSIVREDSYVIIDLCSYMTRCGVGVNDPNRLPAYLIPTVVGELSTATVASGAAEEAAKDDTTPNEAEPAAETGDSEAKPTVGSTSQPTYVVGESALRKLTDKDSAPVWPMASDHVDDWDRMVIFWEYILAKRFKLKFDNMESPVLLSVPTQWSRLETERTAQIFFERFNVPGLYIAEQPLLAAYGSGVLTALVVKIGHRYTDITPVIDSNIQYQAAQRLELAGQDIDQRLLELLRKDKALVELLGDDLNLAFSQMVKENHLDLSPLTEDDETVPALPTAVAGATALAAASKKEAADKAGPQRIEFEYKGKKISLNTDVAKSVEVLFNPELAPKRSLDLVTAIERAVLQCDVDKRMALWDCLLLTGGLSLTKGLPQLLERRLKSRVLAQSDNAGDTQPQEVKFGRIPEYFSRYKDRPDYMAYLGATIAAKLVFNDPKNYVHKADYNEMGPAAIFCKNN